MEQNLITVLDTREIKGALARIPAKRSDNISVSVGKQGVQVVYHNAGIWYSVLLTKGSGVWQVPWTAILSLDDVKQAVKMAGTDGIEVKEVEGMDYVMFGGYRVRQYKYNYPVMPAWVPENGECCRIVLPVAQVMEISKFTSAQTNGVTNYYNNTCQYNHDEGKLIMTDGRILAAFNPSKLKCSGISTRDFDFKVGLPAKVFGKSEVIEVVSWEDKGYSYTQYDMDIMQVVIRADSGKFPNWKQIVLPVEDGIKVALPDNGLKGWVIGLLQEWQKRQFNTVYIVLHGGRIALTPMVQRREFEIATPWYDETAIGYVTGEYQGDAVITQFNIAYLLNSLLAVAADNQDITLYLFKDVSALDGQVTYRAQVYGPCGFIIVMPKKYYVDQVGELMEVIKRKCVE